jgi:hypothetical protein
MDPGSGSGVTVLKDSGFARPHFRHSGLDLSLPRTRSGGIHVYRDETAEALPEGAEDPPEGPKYLRPPSADQHGPRVFARGDG